MISMRAGALACLLAIVGCYGDRAPAILALGPDWNCLSYPTAFRPSGTVYQVDNRTGGQRTFYDFSAVAANGIREKPFVDVSAIRTNQANANVIASILGLPVKAQADLRRTYQVSQSFGSAFQTDVDQGTANRLADAFRSSDLLAEAIKRGQTAGHSYYLVRNTIRATEVTYSFNRDISVDINVDVVPATAGTIEAKAGVSDARGTKYSKTFKDPQIVCIQPDDLELPKPVRNRLIPFSAPAPHWTAGPGDQPLFKP